MKKKFNKFIYILILCILNSSASKLFSQDSNDIYLNVEAPMLTEVSENDQESRTPKSFAEELMAVSKDYVTQPLLQHTRRPTTRDVLYLMPQKFSTKKKNELALNFFYNEVPNTRLTVGTLLQENAIADKDAIIDQALQDVSDPQDKKTVFPLFKKVTTQERRIGFLAQARVKKGPVTGQIRTSLFIDERNCWLGFSDTKKLLSILNVKMSDIPIKEFFRLNAGIGDTRLSLGFENLGSQQWKFDIGMQTTIPTSLLSYRQKYRTNIEKIAATTNMDSLKNEALTIARTIRNYFLDPQFGNSGHLGLGLYLEPQTHVFHEKIRLWGHFSFDALFAANEDRLFFFKPTSSVEQVVTYLEQNIFPSALNVKVCPSPIFNSIIAASTNVGKTQLTLGYDFYAQQRETIQKINNSSATLEELNIEATESLKALQHKIFLEALYEKKKKIKLGVGGDFTVARLNIGNDWTAYLKTTFFF